MVLNDITNDYKQFLKILDFYHTPDGFIASALNLINQYHSRINILADTFLKSSKRDLERTTLASGLNSLESAFLQQIANMNTSMRDTTRLITEIEHIDFVSLSVKENADSLCNSLNVLMDITEEYAANKIKNSSNTSTFFKLVAELDNFKNVYGQINSNHDILVNIEDELLEKLPFEQTEENKIYTLDIRSCKPELNLSSFSDDLQLLSNCLQQFERLVNPITENSIYLRKIESGSLKAMFGSNKIDFSIFPDLITSISNAIKAWRTTRNEKTKIDAETEKIKAEAALISAQAESQIIQNEGTKIAIINSQIDYICEKLNLNAKDPANTEQIQQFCLPLINYIERNPIGIINGISYDISREVHLLENPKD